MAHDAILFFATIHVSVHRQRHSHDKKNVFEQKSMHVAHREYTEQGVVKSTSCIFMYCATLVVADTTKTHSPDAMHTANRGSVLFAIYIYANEGEKYVYYACFFTVIYVLLLYAYV